MSRLLVFQHVAAEPLGTLDPLIRRRGHRIRFVNFEREPDAQPDVDRYHGLIVLGGPMNVEDRERRVHLRTELHAIERALAQDKPVLGICLGAQLLAHVLGAPIRRLPRAEIGWYDLHTSGAGREDPVLGALGAQSPVFQWHSYGFDLPSGAEHLAHSADCPHQAFRAGRHAYGFQFHLEMDAALIERWLARPEYHEDLCAANLGHDAHAIRQQTTDLIAPMQTRADAAFNAFLDLVGRPQRRVTLASREWV
jgi:GMP synthase (glutamine-hydrolysing)